MLSASHVAESLRDSVVPQLGCGVSLGEADLRGGVQREVSGGLAISVADIDRAQGSPARSRVGFEIYLAQVGGRQVSVDLRGD